MYMANDLFVVAFVFVVITFVSVVSLFVLCIGSGSRCVVP